jgi:3-methyl-2-oxobutanoate hydroxymethyltransferase
MSYHVSRRQAIRAAGRMIKETNCQAVKLEGGRKKAKTIRSIVDSEIPVMGHIGLTPQSVRRMGGFKVQRGAEELMEDANAVADAGAFAIVLECIPADVAAAITAKIPIPTIGIGAGAACDGQILVLHDMLGLFDTFRPRFVRRYAELGSMIRGAVENYAKDVESGDFPNAEESFR